MTDDRAREKRRIELYRTVRARYPDLFQQAVNIGSLVICLQGSKQHKAAEVEASVMSLILQIMER